MGNEIGDEFACNWAKTESKHGMAGHDSGILQAWDRADARKAVGSAGAQAGPRLNAGEIVRSEGGEKFAEALDDALEAGAIDRKIGAADFHGAPDAQFVAHGGDGDAGVWAAGRQLSIHESI